ncbi:MAG: DUF429 domain-containing protein [Microbacterium sp. 14-71-5]|nr:MAG: DUF429 domain-containing protein [Microbacterium sp. 14-71-5]
MHFLGVDLAWADGGHANETGLVYLDPDGVILAAGWTRGVEDTVAWIDAHVNAPNVLAFVDAPLVITNATGQRLCERQVGQCYGRWLVSANSTNTTHPNAAGAALLARMQAVGWLYDSGMDGPARSGRRISECYPYTTLVGAHEFGYGVARPTYKRKPRAVAASQWRATRAATCDDLILRLAKLAQAEPRLDLGSHPVTAALLLEPSPLADRAYKHREDLIDAVLCAWTARLWSRYGFTRCQVLGDQDGEPALAATIIAPSQWDQRLASVSTALPSHG